MVCLGFESGVAGWKEQMNPLGQAGNPINNNIPTPGGVIDVSEEKFNQVLLSSCCLQLFLVVYSFNLVINTKVFICFSCYLVFFCKKVNSLTVVYSNCIKYAFNVTPVVFPIRLLLKNKNINQRTLSISYELAE